MKCINAGEMGMNSRASFEVGKISNGVSVPERLMNGMKPGIVVVQLRKEEHLRTCVVGIMK